MPLLNFKKQFATMVGAGLTVRTTSPPGTVETIIKRQTIRAKRSDGKNPHAGEMLYLYTGLRTKSCRKLGEAVCMSVEEISIYQAGIVRGGEWLTIRDQELLARADGFQNFSEMAAWFERVHGLPFWGLLVKW